MKTTGRKSRFRTSGIENSFMRLKTSYPKKYKTRRNLPQPREREREREREMELLKADCCRGELSKQSSALGRKKARRRREEKRRGR
jgi:hypothetical protein